jgi:hypothetical protein
MFVVARICPSTDTNYAGEGLRGRASRILVPMVACWHNT